LACERRAVGCWAVTHRSIDRSSSLTTHGSRSPVFCISVSQSCVTCANVAVFHFTPLHLLCHYYLPLRQLLYALRSFVLAPLSPSYVAVHCSLLQEPHCSHRLSRLPCHNNCSTLRLTALLLSFLFLCFLFVPQVA
jgi:hypothetical protein